MKHEECYQKMIDVGLISYRCQHQLKLLNTCIKAPEINENERDHIMILFELYYMLNEDGNVYMSLDASILKEKVEKKLNGKEAELREQLEDASTSKTKKTSEKITTLGQIRNELLSAINDVSKLSNLKSIISEAPANAVDFSSVKNHLFVISQSRLFTQKHYKAVCIITKKMKELFEDNVGEEEKYDDSIIDDANGFKLSKEQISVIEKGMNNNLLITGGPGTGKTTSIFFLLLALFSKKENMNKEVFLSAPSAKAASRMRDSVLGNKGKLKAPVSQVNSEIVKELEKLKSFTIHRLLGPDYKVNGFLHNDKNQFSKDSIFIIDEASMIDVCLFAALLQAIPKGARVFIMGDKNQLPSVECGAVFGELLDKYKDKMIPCATNPTIKANVTVYLEQSNRFKEDSTIYKLAKRFNECSNLEIKKEDFLPPVSNNSEGVHGYTVEKDGKSGELVRFYADNSEASQKDMMNTIIKKWYAAYYSELHKKCLDIQKEDSKSIYEVFQACEHARILCACNEGTRGVNTINRQMIDMQKSEDDFTSKQMIGGRFAGELLLITKNNNSLDLYNGDSGVAITFENDPTLYVAFNKISEFPLEERTKSNWDRLQNKIFKMVYQDQEGKKFEYVFYPLSFLSSEDVQPAFAISIHKSQGSDYQNIMVILPRKKEHPLLNRQIIYTAITRTKGNTYILSNLENLEAARDNVLVRDTGIL